MTSWLSRQKKQELIDLGNAAGLKSDVESRKDELVEKLDEFLQQNATRLSSNELFGHYYGAHRRTPGRPTASGAVTSGDETEVKSVVRGRGRKPTAVKSEDEDAGGPLSSPSAAATALVQKAKSLVPSKTPAKTSAVAPTRRRSSLPPSPSIIAKEVEDRTNAFYDGIFASYKDSAIPGAILSLRETCSSVFAVQSVFLMLEAYALNANLIPWKYAFDFPPNAALRTPEVAVKLPDLFILLTSFFWTTSLTWATTSLVVPAVVAYFFNLSVKHVKRHGVPYDVPRYPIDPLSFNVVKGLVTWLVYSKGWSFGLVSPLTASRVDTAMLGGYNGVLLGCYVTIIAIIYEAAQRR